MIESKQLGIPIRQLVEQRLCLRLINGPITMENERLGGKQSQSPMKYNKKLRDLKHKLRKKAGDEVKRSVTEVKAICHQVGDTSKI